MTYQLAFFRKAGMIVRYNALKLLDSLAPVVNAGCLILDDSLEDFNALDILSRITASLLLNVSKQLLRPALPIKRSHDSHSCSNYSGSKERIDISKCSTILLQLTHQQILPCPITRETRHCHLQSKVSRFEMCHHNSVSLRSSSRNGYPGIMCLKPDCAQIDSHIVGHNSSRQGQQSNPMCRYERHRRTEEPQRQ